MLEKTNLMNMCMICDGDKVLVIDRKKPNWPGVTFPGGHVEKDESLVDSVIREVKEETGLIIDSPILCGITDWCNEEDRDVVLLYKSTLFSGELKSSDEGEVWWERYDNLRNLKLTSGFETYLKVYENDNLGELFYRRMDDGTWKEELK